MIPYWNSVAAGSNFEDETGYSCRHAADTAGIVVELFV